MRQSKIFIPTLREQTETDSRSHGMMLRSGMIKQTAAGVYSYLPMAKKVLNNIETIIREEMENIDSIEVQMPVLQPKELWQESERWDDYGAELMRLNDRHGREFALGPTHEEVITSLVRDELKSYKKLPITLFQIQSKFRDEIRPRYGLLRGREFIMKDAYSFHIDEASLSETYDNMYNAYYKIFKRVGLNVRAVRADSGAIGGNYTHEFMALADIGEDTICFDPESDYAANIETAIPVNKPLSHQGEEKPLEKVETPNVKKSIEAARFLNVSIEEMSKTLVVKYVVDNELKYAMFILRGDHELNEIFAMRALNVKSMEMVSEDEVKSLFGATFGSLGPVEVDHMPIYVDNAIKGHQHITTGANEDGYHYINVSIDRDIKDPIYGHYRFIQQGEFAEGSKSPVEFAEGIEVGQVFKLGTKYSSSMKAEVLNDQGRSVPMIMGCYGIGVSRTLAAVIEQHMLEDSLVWPKSITPYDVHIILPNMKDSETTEFAFELYESLKQNGYNVLIDDRNERAGVKFNDADLIGIPLRITIGRGYKSGVVEFTNRLKLHESKEVDKEEIKIDHIIDTVKQAYE
ncbi:proline--tRNA ligase [Abyssicoccus albus]|uniref:proline--tRNA ligase n=1 Tax=Abyssicoccus albus TaxID=1817405 RepID=UPI00097E1AA0|nr:proline--tRNA ligase [Abyssicoccus albus]AQL56303.1 proline--tRNA ligase [Abyssicoccus albus]